jgi:hypothetical protein
MVAQHHIHKTLSHVKAKPLRAIDIDAEARRLGWDRSLVVNTLRVGCYRGQVVACIDSNTGRLKYYWTDDE